MDISSTATNSITAQPAAMASVSGTTRKLSPVEEAKLRKAAADFESILLSTFWKSMKESFSSDDDEDSTDPAHDTLEDMGMQAMSSAVGKASGLGLGKLILKHIAPELGDQPGPQFNAVTTKPLPASADKKG